MLPLNIALNMYICATNTIIFFFYFNVEMSSKNTPMTHTNDIDRRRELRRYYDRRSIQIEDNENRQIRLARRCANYARRRQQTLGGDITLVGSLANLNEDVVHSNSTLLCVSLIPPNRVATPSCRLTHIRNLVRNMPVERNAMQEINGEILILYLLKNTSISRA